jgi:FKBP-type peptidyl-prolyl cis-trans isomerase
MNSAVGSREARLPIERRCRTSLSVNGLAVAVLLTGATLAQAQNAPPPAAPAASTPAPATAKKPAAKTPAKECAAAAKTPASPKIQGSYALGVSMGEQLHRAGLTNDSVAVERIAQGLRDALSGKAKMTEAEQESIASLVRGARAGAGEANHAAAAAFLAENAKKKDIVTTPSGLQYKVITPGNGEAPKPTDQVSVNYRGTLLDGTEFDSSYKRGQPATFPVNGVIPGWQEALVLMKPGSKYELYIPPKLAYDLESPPAIPPGSMLKFEVELLSVKPPQAAAPHPDVHPQPQQAPPPK